jgi:hypothetical protein
MEVWTPYFFALLAGAFEIAGQIEEALTLLDDALQRTRQEIIIAMTETTVKAPLHQRI